jgi:hypothetical protein
MSKAELIYLASPYNHAKASMRAVRYQAVLTATADLMRAGRIVYSPIVHNHPIAISDEGLPRDWEYWKQFDEVILSRCDRLWILTIDGWRESVGIKGEIEIAQNLQLPIELVNWSSGNLAIGSYTQ